MTNKPEYKKTFEARQREKGFVKVHDTWVPEEYRQDLLDVARSMRERRVVTFLKNLLNRLTSR